MTDLLQAELLDITEHRAYLLKEIEKLESELVTAEEEIQIIEKKLGTHIPF